MTQEFRCVLTPAEATELNKNISAIESATFITDTYDGEKRTRAIAGEPIKEKPYKTPVTGSVSRYSFNTHYKNIPCWLEIKWTESGVMRWEIEFEKEVPEEFKNKENIPGWNILQRHQ
ncbi:MAG: hypothetical protein HOJ15_04610 [Candidatus Jacksonbacteria bacterium]|jgi:hypothetical protein|nr:hypothetical protein [Candidatus Jacksonbacteria bacterium]MBT6034426.1 hypothetical protein [Candidatus Jacksonbacteria bacterium]MBT6301679.1 hypothetical protein [Candidatus Jacksonbacteria bacterium]MBT6757171.1 hypothetical protein [Candidatus Jacksonbacteria bacterium]MBT6955368.1 hypothetical protein [Candidatus Jacksonbacteria bacterium]